MGHVMHSTSGLTIAALGSGTGVVLSWMICKDERHFELVIEEVLIATCSIAMAPLHPSLPCLHESNMNAKVSHWTHVAQHCYAVLKP
jgi:hypothetical protein